MNDLSSDALGHTLFSRHPDAGYEKRIRNGNSASRQKSSCKSSIFVIGVVPSAL
jgi:hypothetical protein